MTTNLEHSFDTQSVEEQVLRLAARGWPLLPCVTRDKMPLINNWRKRATVDSQTLTQWLKRWPQCNWAAVTGPRSRFFVLDVDGQPGEDAIHRFSIDGKALPDTLSVGTARGRHLYFVYSRETGINNSVSRLSEGLDIRGEGGYVIVPPSVHPTGVAYKWLADFDQTPIAEAPIWLLEELQQKQSGQRIYGVAGIVPEGQRNSHLTSLAGVMVRSRMSLSAINAALLATNAESCRPPLAEKEVQQIGLSVHRYRSIPVTEAAAPISAEIVTLSQIEPQEVSWLWEPYIARGTLSMLSGDPGAGKTYVSLAIAAAITLGQVPGGHPSSPPADVLYLSVENSAAHVVRPRFNLLGGDPRRFHILRGSIMGEGETAHRGAIRLSDISLLSDALKKTQARLVIVDPIQSYLGANVDAHRSNETRPVLDGLVGLAEEYNCSMLLVRHLGKARTGRAIHSGLGSIDLTGAVRTEQLAGSAPANSEQRALVQIKSNLGRLGSSLGYVIGPQGLQWTGECSLTAEAILAPDFTAEEVGAMEEAEDFLREALATGPMPANEIQDAARAQGIALKTLKRAKKQLRIGSAKKGMKAGWVWSMPERGQK
jgi:hypothetical protein